MAIRTITKQSGSTGGSRRSYDIRVSHRKGQTNKAKGYTAPDKYLFAMSPDILARIGVEGKAALCLAYDDETGETLIYHDTSEPSWAYSMRESRGFWELSAALPHDIENAVSWSRTPREFHYGVNLTVREEAGVRFLALAPHPSWTNPNAPEDTGDQDEAQVDETTPAGDPEPEAPAKPPRARKRRAPAKS